MATCSAIYSWDGLRSLVWLFSFFMDAVIAFGLGEQVVELDLKTVVPCCSGPKRPQDKVAVSDMKKDFESCLGAKVGPDLYPAPLCPGFHLVITLPGPWCQGHFSSFLNFMRPPWTMGPATSLQHMPVYKCNPCSCIYPFSVPPAALVALIAQAL